jgi:hypothetical protein
VLVTGSQKAEILAKSVEGPISSTVTASALQLHAHCTVVVDEEAGRRCCRTKIITGGFSTTNRNGESFTHTRPSG